MNLELKFNEDVDDKAVKAGEFIFSYLTKMYEPKIEVIDGKKLNIYHDKDSLNIEIKNRILEDALEVKLLSYNLEAGELTEEDVIKTKITKVAKVA